MVLLGPVAVDVGVKFSFSGTHEADERLVASVFVAGGPENHFGQNRSQVDALGGQLVDQLAAISRITLGSQDSVVFKPAQTIGEDIGGNLFFRSQKLVEGLVAAQHHVAEDEERPAIAEHLDGGV